jgi:hypothetical protein
MAPFSSAEIISHCVWLYFRFTINFRDVEEMLAMRVWPFAMRLSKIEIYEEALDALLKKWDSTRRIKRDQAYRTSCYFLS